MRGKRPLSCSDRLSPCSLVVGAPHNPRLPLQNGALGDTGPLLSPAVLTSLLGYCSVHPDATVPSHHFFGPEAEIR